MVQIPISRVLNTHVGGRAICPASFSVSVPPPVNPLLKYERNHSQER